MAIITGTAGADSLVGGSTADEIRGLGGNDTLIGGAGADSLLGGGGIDSLSGGSGADTMAGGGGNDTYIVENAADVVTEDAGEGTQDTVKSSVTYTLTAEVEHLTLTGNGDIDGTGNSSGNVITGNGGSNILDGVGGNDTLLGGAGNDVLIYDAADGSVNGGAGTDVLQLTGTSATLDLALVPNTVIRDVEVIDITGTGNNTLKLAASDLLALSSTTNILRVDGNAGDRVVTVDGNWSFVQNLTIGGEAYVEYVNGSATLQVDANVYRGGIAQSVRNLADGGFRINGNGNGDLTGVSVSTAGDINGDGYDDIIVGAIGRGSFHGASYVIFGKASPEFVYLPTLNGTNGFQLPGVAAGDLMGNSVSTAGDVNGDGYDDLIVGAVIADANGADSGASYVVFGKASGFTSTFNPSSLNGDNGFRLVGAAADDQAGISVSDAGDVNGDGFGDLIVGADGADPNGASSGASYVIFGKASGFASSINLATLNGTNGFRLTGAASDDRSGYSVSSAGDVNGDGLDDLIVGAFGADPNGSFSGASYVVFGKAGFAASVNLGALNGANGFRLEGAAADDRSGYSVSGAGDVNGDGFDDLIVGARFADPNGSNSGSSYVVFGKAVGFAASLDLGALNGANGFRLDGKAIDDKSGFFVSGAGDVNGDGFDDLIVGAPEANANGSNSGASYVVFGKAAGFASSMDLSSLDGKSGFKILVTDSSDRAGYSVSAAGDVNGDGFDDLLVGAYQANVGTRYNVGAAYVILGDDFTGAVTFLGTNGADSLAGSTAGERFVSGRGDDTLIGNGGKDVFSGGRGSDLIQVLNTAFSNVGGGGGIDTLAILGSGRTLDLTTRANNKISGIETIDITGSGANTLKLTRLDLFDLSDSTNQLMVDGNTGDTVDLVGGWSGPTAMGAYNSYTLGAATILIDTDVFVV